MTQANADVEDIDPLNVADVFALGASLIDQYDSGTSTGTDDVDTVGPHITGTHITIIKTGSGVGDFVLGWENVGGLNGEAKAAGDPTDNNPLAPKNPYNWITNDGTATGTKKTPPDIYSYWYSTTLFRTQATWAMALGQNTPRTVFSVWISTRPTPMLPFWTFLPITRLITTIRESGSQISIRKTFQWSLRFCKTH